MKRRSLVCARSQSISFLFVCRLCCWDGRCGEDISGTARFGVASYSLASGPLSIVLRCD